MKKIITVILSLIIGLSITNYCKAEDSLFINKTNATIEEKKTIQLYVNTEPGFISWNSTDENIATVSGTGLVTAVKEGNAQIIANVFGNILTCSVTVTKPKAKKNTHLTASQSVVVLPITNSIKINLTHYKLSESDIKIAPLQTDIVKCDIVKSSKSSMTVSFKPINPGCTDVYLYAKYKDGTKEKIKISVTVLDNIGLLPTYVDK